MARPKRYYEHSRVVSNFTNKVTSTPENKTIDVLLKNKVEGFQFSLYFNAARSNVFYMSPQGELKDFEEVIVLFKQHLEDNPNAILTLFLDIHLPVEALQHLFIETGFIDFFHVQADAEEWPFIHQMVDSNKRVVVFGVETVGPQPEWLHPLWNYAVEPYFSLFETPEFAGEFLKGDLSSRLLVLNDFNRPINALGEQPGFIIDRSSEHLLLNHCVNVWNRTGKVPAFIFLDHYAPRIRNILDALNNFITISGTVSYNLKPVDYVIWKNRSNCQTHGVYNFPVLPGDKINLVPESPGFVFNPDQVFFDEPDQMVTQNFRAIPVQLEDQLKLHLDFKEGAKDASRSGFNTKPAGVSFTTDPLRGKVAFFDGNDYIVLPKAEELNLRNHDFTIMAWVKLEPNDNYDNSIIGTTVQSYQEGIHFTIRDSRPYFGFYSNDVQGKTRLEEGLWYHVACRYNRLNGEQAIFVNGKPDSRSLGHLPYQGKETIMIGSASFAWPAFFNGYIDDLAIWDRALGEEEIWNISQEVVAIQPATTSWPITLVVLAIIGFAVVSLVLLKFYRLAKAKKPEKAKKYVDTTSFSAPTEGAPNQLRLFGSFRVFNAAGEDISHKFPPKLKNLFLFILFRSTKGKKGVTTDELTRTLWPDLEYKSAINTRGVNIRKLRILLEQIGGIDVENKGECWKVTFSNNIKCDYFDFLELADKSTLREKSVYEKIFELVKPGQLIKNESYEWLDEIRNNTDYIIVDILNKYIGLLDFKEESDLMLKIIERIEVSDPVHEQSFELKMRILVRQKNLNFARYSFDTFTKNYKQFFGQPYEKSFNAYIEEYH